MTNPYLKMKKNARLLLLLLCFACMGTPAWAERLVVLTPDVADIVAKLGSANQVVGIHDYNENPAYQHTPTIGFYRNFSAEPIVSKKPNLVLGSWLAKPEGIYAQIAKSGIHTQNVNPTESLESYQDSILKIGKALHKEPQAKALLQAFTHQIHHLSPTHKRYILSYDGRYVAGKGTVGDTLIRLAGGINAASSINGLKPLSREGWLAAQPDIVIVAKHNEQAIGGLNKLKARPELANSNAARHRKIFFWNGDDFLRYGLHTTDVVKRLNQLGQ